MMRIVSHAAGVSFVTAWLWDQRVQGDNVLLISRTPIIQ